jgi:hypothetical protein
MFFGNFAIVRFLEDWMPAVDATITIKNYAFGVIYADSSVLFQM